jgi:predicted enzyme related to lactoylglutathione lyase
MSDIHIPQVGSFCWIELATTDQDAAKKFYGSLLGWSATDSPMGPGQVYTMFALDGRNSGACYTLLPEMRAHGVPPHWMVYVSVANADEMVAKARAAGAKILSGPIGVMDYGRMAVFQDPTGAHLAIWEPKSHKGFAVEGHAGAFCWADLMTGDPDRAAQFYESVFGWKAELGKDNSGYLHIKNGEKYIGGIPPAQHRDPNAPPNWLIYLMVQDCDASTAKAKAGGAKVYFGPTSMAGVGRWAVIADPQGAVFSLFQSGR